MSYTLGVDIGTYQSKGVLVDAAGTLVAQASRDHEMLVPQAGWAEHRPEEDWWGDFVHICRNLLSESGVDPADIRAIGCSAIGPCMLPVDESGTPLMNGVLYGVDTRSAQEITDMTDAIGADRILQRCGNALTTQAIGPKILWLKRNHPDIWERTHKILTATSFLVHRLTGAFVIDHYTAANSAPFYDAGTQDWCFDLAPDMCDRAQMPELRWTGDIVGEVTEDAARATGLARGTPVITGTIDAAAEAVSVGVQTPGDMMMMYGSTVFIIEVMDRRVADPRLWYAPWLKPGTHASMAGMATSGTLTHWFRDTFARELPRETAFATLAAEAREAPLGAKGLLMLPYFSGERTPIHDPDAKGAFFGLNITHTRGDMYRALLEGIAYGTAHVTETFASAGAAPSRILAVGGGVKNDVWLQATSDISGVPQIVCEKTIGASYGDAFLAAEAVGIVESGDIEHWNPAARAVEPNRDPIYERQFALFKQLYLDSRDVAHGL